LSESASARAALAAQMADLADLALAGHRGYLDGMKEGDGKRAAMAQYERERKELVMSLVNSGHLDVAASLAEKYLEFHALVALCEANGDRERLEHYMNAFSEHGFSEFVFSWHVR